MDVGVIQFWGGIAVAALTSAVNIIITLYKTHKTSSDLSSQIDDNKNSLEKNINANINSLEKELKTKIGVEVLSKNRQEWINQVRDCVITLEVNLNYIKLVFNQKCITSPDKKKLTYELTDIYMKTINSLVKLQLLMSPKKNTEKKMNESANDYRIRKRSNLCMLILNKKLEKLKDIMWDYKTRAEGVICNYELHHLLTYSNQKITHSSFGILFITKKLIQIEWKRISEIQ